jgi:hypothetical protein
MSMGTEPLSRFAPSQTRLMFFLYSGSMGLASASMKKHLLAAADGVAAGKERDRLLDVEALFGEVAYELRHRDVGPRQVVCVLAVGHERVAPAGRDLVGGAAGQPHCVAGADGDDVRALLLLSVLMSSMTSYPFTEMLGPASFSEDWFDSGRAAALESTNRCIKNRNRER